MTPTKVVDTSALAALLFDEPEADEVAARLAGARLVAPALLVFELANVCWTKCRRTPDRRDALFTAFHAWRRLRIEEVPVDDADLIGLALETGLTVYDASYLHLARRLGADLVTLDRALQRAAASTASSG